MGGTQEKLDYGLGSRKFTAPLTFEKLMRTVYIPAVPAEFTNVPLSVKERELTCAPATSSITSHAVPVRLLGN